MALRVLIAPSGFKESLEAEEVADCIEEGVLRAAPGAEVSKAPMVDGGEGFTKTLVNATGGTLHELTVTGPVGEPVESHIGFLGGEGPRTAVLEMAAAAGLRLVPRDLRDPSGTTTYGVGELIHAALDAGAECILVGCGDSGTTDGGAGMAQALGVRLLDRTGVEIGQGGAGPACEHGPLGTRPAPRHRTDSISSVDQDLDVWSDLADTEEEQQQVEEVGAAYEKVVRDANEVFDLAEAGRMQEAVNLAEIRLEVQQDPVQPQEPPAPVEQSDDELQDEDDVEGGEGDEGLEGSGREEIRVELVAFLQEQPNENSFQAFESATDGAIASDLSAREGVLAQTQNTRRTAQLVLVIASFGTLSLLLLLAAYLASDLFRPLRELRQALEDVEKGDLDRRIDEERADELGEMSRAFNRAMGSISRREGLNGIVATAAGEGGDVDTTWKGSPSRVTLHRLVSQLRSRISQLDDAGVRNGHATEQEELVGQLEGLSQAVARITDFGFPLDLNLSRTDMRALLYWVFMRFQDEFSERAVSIELDIAPEVDHAVVDRLKLREAVGELLRNALSALPEAGGRLGLRSRISEDGMDLLIEVADDGQGAEQSLIDDAFDPGSDGPEGRPRVGLALTRAIVEQHGGALDVESVPGGGTYARIQLPLRD